MLTRPVQMRRPFSRSHAPHPVMRRTRWLERSATVVPAETRSAPSLSIFSAAISYDVFSAMPLIFCMRVSATTLSLLRMGIIVPLMLVHRFDKGMPLPVYGSAGAAGFDIHLSRIERPLARHLASPELLPQGFRETSEGWQILPGGLVHARSGLGFHIPKGHYLDIRGRSGWTGCALVVLPGVIDDYLGEVGAHIVNLGREPLPVKRGMKICQAILKRYEHASFEEDEQAWGQLNTERGTNGFGSTGA